ncbi:MAG TPA: amidohydrolase family protein [Verrucomicrobiae bacterium]|nr:amidohydrolase family protein [Verrucomicrobiae bacterium]
MSNAGSPTLAASLKPVDMHVHMVGNGAGGSGCWLRLKGPHRALAGLMLRGLGLPGNALSGDFERYYVQRLLQLIRESSLGAVVLLAHDQVYEVTGQRMEGAGSFYVPNEFLLKLAREHPEFLPAVSIHPARPDAMEELEKCLAAGAVMMKCLPNCHNIDCNDRRYSRFWERMAASGLPLLAHTGGEHTVPVVNKKFEDPRTLTLPLHCGVTVIAAHSGTKSGWSDVDYFPVFVEMTKRFPRLYGDTSALLTLNRCGHLRDCLQPGIVERIVHGSDVPVPVLAHRAWLKGFFDWDTFRRWQRHPNVLERDYQLKRAMGFPEEVFTRIHSLLRYRPMPPSS